MKINCEQLNAKKRSRKIRLQISCKMDLSRNVSRTVHKNARTNHKVLVCLVFVTSLLTFVYGCTISNISHTSESSSSIYLHWDLTQDCPEESGTFQIVAKHRKYLACNERIIGAESRLETNQTFAVLSNLNPYSLYQIQISGQLKWERINRTFEATTVESYPKVRPIKLDNSSNLFVQAITFHWASPFPGSCELRNGKPNGYRIELWGLDPWVSRGKFLREDKVQESIHVPQYYAQQLLPYTQYKLKVFAVNSVDNLYNPKMPLELVERTLPTVPLPPEEVKVTLATSRTVHLNWRPKYPPNGLIRLYVIRIGVMTDNEENGGKKIVWRRRIEVEPSSSYCRQANSGVANSVCYVVENLEPDTTYNFQVQAFNDNVNKSSDFSEGAIANTDALPNAAGNGGKVDEITTQNSAFREVDNMSTDGNGSTGKILTIVLTLGAIVIMVIACTALYYKIKMNKLELLYEQSRQNYNSGPASFIGSSGYPQIVSFNRGSGLLSSGHVVLPHNGMTTANYIQAVANQIEEIQSRRLPEPPPTKASQKRHSRDVDDDSASDAYVKIENDSGNGSLVSRFHRVLPNHPDLLESLHSSSTSREASSVDECTDIDGYLKPTFNRFSSTSNDFRSSNSSLNVVDPIPVESYVNPREINNRSTSTERQTSSTESHSTSTERHSLSSESSYDRPRNPNGLVAQSSTSSENHPLISLTG